MPMSRVPTKEEIDEVIKAESEIAKKTAEAKKELAEMEPGSWLVFEAEDSTGAVIGALGIRFLVPNTGDYDVINYGNKTFVHRLK